MKKKGFTLVELLAVIAILAILVIIALPNVMGMFNESKKSTFVTEVRAIYKQVATDFVTQSMKGAGEQEYCQKSTSGAVTNIEYKKASTDTNDMTCTNNTLKLTTTKGYYVKVSSDGKIQKLVVYDPSYYFSSPGEIDKATDISEATIKEVTTLTKTLLVGNPAAETKTFPAQ